MRIMLFWLLSCFLLVAAFAQTPSAFIAGKVVDENGKPLPFANVQVTDGFDGEVSSEAGMFVIAMSLSSRPAATTAI